MNNNITERALQHIKDQIQRLEVTSQQLAQHFNTILKSDFQRHNAQQKEYQESYVKYIQLLNKYQENRLLAPIEVFPGIHTTRAFHDTEEMQRDTEEMKQLALAIKQLEGSLETEESTLTTDLKEVVRTYNSYYRDANNIREALSQLLGELDSVYDVGLLAKNS